LRLRFTGRATMKPAKAPTTVEVLAEDEAKHAEGSQPAKDAYANPAILPIAVNINVIFIVKYNYN
tara:strand:+ start:466 stop:660 length:195 start_codon:yes stop_codon:yes gene_type:complete